MTDPGDARSPSREKPRRAPRFVLPDVHHDERTAERIVAFLDGPAAPVQRRTGSPVGGDRARRPKELDTRPDWLAAFTQEAARHARYGRPASVLLLEIGCPPDGPAIDRVAGGLAELIRGGVRQTDRAVRLGASSFRLLMPETNGQAARRLAARLEGAFQAMYAGRNSRPVLRTGVAAPTRGGSLEDALTDAERHLTG